MSKNKRDIFNKNNLAQSLRINNFIEIAATIIVLALVYSFLFSQIPWKLVFLNTTISGGDTGSHNYVAWYSHEIFPKLKWWSPDWYAGFPFLYFYPPFLYYLTDIFSHFLPLNVSFKIITLLGTLLLPLAIYLFLKLLKFSFPVPLIGALFSLPFLFLEKFSIYGGNLPSTLAGEFSYSFALALFFIFLGLFNKSISEQKTSLLAIFVLALMAISHPFSVIVSVLVVALWLLLSLITKRFKQTFRQALITYGLGFGLSAFWSLPFVILVFSGWVSKMSWTKVIKLDEIFPNSLIPFLFLAVIGILFQFFKKYRNENIFLIGLIILASLIPFLFLNHSSIWNTRFLPFLILSYLILAAIGIGLSFEQLSNVGKFFKNPFLKATSSKILISFFTLILVALVTLVYLPKNITFIGFWFKWNYEGFEKKQPWPQIVALSDYLRTLPYGRVMWEYRGEYDKFGTPRVLEDLPMWTNKPTFEGLLIESSISGYFHFINQAETTKTPTAAIAGMNYPSFNFENGVKYLQLFGANYFVAYTKDIKDLAQKYLIHLKDVDDFSIYEVPHSELVSVIDNIELVPKQKKWIDQSIDWYEQMDFSKFLVFYQNNKEKIDITQNIKPSAVKSLPVIKEITKDSLVFETENLYQPHLIKISYFPGWRVKGGLGPYLISPSFMMVIPTQKQVTLQFGYNLWDKIGMALSLLSFMTLVFLIIRKPFRSLLNLKQKFLIPRD